MICYAHYESPLGGMLLVAQDDAVTGVYFHGQKYFPSPDAQWRSDPNHCTLLQTRRELTEYFAGERTAFDIPTRLHGTAFQRAVWGAIAEVAYGTTITYSELARRVGIAGQPRAAGTATGRNPLTIVVPCHRIVGARGELTGYAGGLDRKRALLALERGEAAAAGARAIDPQRPRATYLMPLTMQSR